MKKLLLIFTIALITIMLSCKKESTIDYGCYECTQIIYTLAADGSVAALNNYKFTKFLKCSMSPTEIVEFQDSRTYSLTFSSNNVLYKKTSSLSYIRVN